MKIKSILRIIRGFFPSLLPIGVTQFDTFCKDMFTDHNLPDLPSYRHAIATMIMNLGPTAAYKSRIYFVLAVRKAQANQVAYEELMRIREDKKETGEATANNGGASSGQQSVSE